MTTFPFLPSTQNVFQFQPSLDGTLYTASVPWNISGQRYYLNLFALNGTRIFTLPLIGSRDAVALEDIQWSNGIVTATAIDPHGYMVGKTIDLYVIGCVPDGFNGRVKALVTGIKEVQYQLSENPGPFTQLGVLDWVINLAAGYFKNSTLVFRSSNATFEVKP